MPEQLTIKKWRLLKDLRQQDVADKLGVARKTVGDWEKEDANVSNVVIYALAKLFNIEIDQIKI
ncbi:helix-turn-helix transcriptional regulator [Staphylococcus borealis]|uniref:helix-turn-helix transcriptional regulator n=1 Tax=Staphylococcus borealis TaxID=2742203 RepID=UPI0009471F3B|nr:helix-turn-helix transcriptional regulator [Staphylococcus borealis]MDO0995110.1 helix-turn-helix transcriptional regulator [Staphylococcus borealis]OLF26763.1 transcriptional regulator [Staphylococcus aureus]